MTGNATFAERIRAERKKRGLTITALAKELNIQKTRVSMWETNGTVPRQDVFVNLCNYFSVSADYLLGNDKEIQKNIKNITLYSIQRGLDKLGPEDLEKAQKILNAAFEEAFKGDNHG